MPPENIYVNTNQVPPQPPPAPAPPEASPVSATPPKKSPFSPKILIFVFGIIAILVFGFLILKGVGVRRTSSEITWWGLWEEASVVTPLIDEYQSQHPGVKINYVMQSPQDYRERLTSRLAEGEGPDIFAFHNSWVPMFRNSLDSLPPAVMNAADYAKTFYPTATSDLTSGTAIVGIPLGYDSLSLFINEDIFSKAGKTPPTTWDDLRVTARELTVKDDQGIITQSGVALGRTENVDHWPEILALLMIQNGVDLSQPTGEAAEGALVFFTLFTTDDGVWDATLPPSTQAFASGKLAMYFGPSWRAFEIGQQNPNLKFKTVTVPQLPKDSPQQPDITYATYWAQGVSAKSAGKAVAWDFLKFLSTQESLQKLFDNQRRVRSFGEPYPRPDMASLLADHPVVGSIISQAPGAQTWFLHSRTFDGPTGINSQMANYFGDAINALNSGTKTATQALETVATGVTQVLSTYGLTR
ncbi:MAG TPA: extracellular solute-binding protein [Patescibacteria group bacterium]|nr:extracellular solute-binding protein [Patescibacteria group bacterium]